MKRAIYPLFAAADESRAKPILKAMQKEGVTIRDLDADPGPKDALVLFLSRELTGDDRALESFFRLNAGRKLVIPVYLDEAAPPEDVQNALKARHAIFAQRYSTDELSSRIAKALEKENRLPLILSLTAAAALLAVCGVILWKSLPKKADPGAVDALAPTAAPALTPAPTQEPQVDVIRDALSEVAEVVYIGDSFHYYTLDMGYHKGTDSGMRSYFELAYDSWENGECRFFSTENGQQIPMGALGDVSYLSLLNNLLFATFINVEGELPDLSALPNLKAVNIINCDIPDIQGLDGSGILHFTYWGDSVKDFTPLNGCAQLREAVICPWDDPAGVDLVDFHPAKLNRLEVNGSVDRLDGVSQCAKLEELFLTNVTCTDLSFLKGLDLLRLRLEHLPRLTSLKGLEDMWTLIQLNVHGCARLADISALDGCNSLNEVQISSDYDRMYALTDVSVLGSLPRLQTIELHGVNVRDVNFLNDLKIKKNVRLGLSLQNADYSGLEAIDTFTFLNLNTDGNYAAAAPYIAGKPVRQLMIYDGGLVDLSTLPDIPANGELDLCRCLNRDLTGLSETFFSGKLWIQDCPYFSSFDGIENLSGFGKTGSILAVENCPRLVDWSGIEGMSFSQLEIEGVFTLPDFSRVSFMDLTLGYIDGETLPDLGCLRAVDPNGRYNFRFEGLDRIADLSPLYPLYGHSLAVPPQVGEQARALVEDGHFSTWEIVYPDGGWDPNDVQVQLMSLEELDTLPPSLLKHVKSLTLVGDHLIDRNATEYWSDWGDQHNNMPAAVLEDRSTNEEIRITRVGTQLTDLSRLSALTGLTELTLWYQPLTSLEGIQAMSDLVRLNVMFCPRLTEASAAFTLQALQEINFEKCPIASLQGVQNLYALEELEVCNTRITSLEGIEGLDHLARIRIAGTNVKDLSPLAQIDFTFAAEERGGVSLALNVMNSRELPDDAFAFLKNIPAFHSLETHSIPAKLWLDHVMDKPMRELHADDTDMTEEQFEAFVAAHPGLEYVSISWNQRITDVSCLLDLPELREVCLSRNMEEAIASLGTGYGFRLRLD